MGFEHIRVGHASAFGHSHSRRSSTCATGGFYESPTVGQSVDSTQPLNITWDPTCLSPSNNKIDIYLYAYSTSSSSRIHIWESVPFSTGSYSATLSPQWWNSTDSMSLQLTIIESGTPPFLSTLPAGPVFTATYSGPALAASQGDSGVTDVSASNSSSSSSRGKIAAAVLLPILFVAALVVVAYLKMTRMKQAEKRKRFSVAVDKRMSTISTDWKSMSGAGANAAIRNSVAVNRNSMAGNRNSSFSFGAIRPAEATETPIHTNYTSNLLANINAENALDKSSTRQMSQLRPARGVGLVGADRVSRVSFAADPRDRVSYADRMSRVSFAADSRPSGESRRSAYVASRAFHNGFVPPLPVRTDYQGSEDESSSQSAGDTGTLSPTQTTGPFSLTAEDIRARLSTAPGEPQYATYAREQDDVMPALSLMRTGDFTMNSTDDLLFDVPESPAATHVKSPKLASASSPVTRVAPDIVSSPISAVNSRFSSGIVRSGSPVTRVASPAGAVGMMPMPASVMSPDDMLRAYALQRRPTSSALSTSAISYPTPVAYNGSGMRVLYTPSNGDAGNNDNNAYVGMAE